MKKKRKVLLLGWDAADWKVINPLMDKGLMPNLLKVVESGVIGDIKTLDPPLSPLLWTSIATGKRPYKHGILGFTEADDEIEGIRPVTVTNRKVRAIWNILSHHNKKTNVVGWWPSHPAEPINGISISNFFQRAGKSIDEPWPLRSKSVHPETMSDLFASMRVHPAEITTSHIAPFIPDWKEVDQKKSQSLKMTAKFLAETAGIHAAGTYIAEFEDWDFLAVYYDAIDHFKHTFMKFNPPRRAHIPEKDFELYKEVITGIYRFHDMMLGRYLSIIDDSTTLMIISDHGFHGDHLRPIEYPKEPSGPAYEHSPYGIFCLKGPGIKKDELIHGASILDITPTLLSLFGLPVGKDMDGKVLINIYDKAPEMKFIDSWENVSGDFGTHPKNEGNSDIDEESLKQLIELGYIEDPGDDVKKAVSQTILENKFYLARAYIDGGQIAKATDLLEELHTSNPDVYRYAFKLAKCYYETLRYDDCQSIIDKLKDPKKEIQLPSLLIMQGMLHLGRKEAKKALVNFEQAAAQIQLQPLLSMRIGHCYRMLRNYEQAEKFYNLELKLNPQNEKALYGLGLCEIEKGNFAASVNYFLDSIGLDYNQPMAHYHLGEALFSIEDMQNSANAFKVSLKLNPSLNKARRRLSFIYSEYLNNKEMAENYEKEIEDYINGEIIIVTGLPRSGTSMLMQMIKKGGVKIFTDNLRTADENNPKGYLEHNAVTTLSRDNSWVKSANGSCIKVISHLVPFLPDTYKYKVLLLNRNIDEVLSSQQNMKTRLGLNADNYSLKLKDDFIQSLEKVRQWAANRDFVQLQEFEYRETINHSEQTAKRICEFLNLNINPEELASVVDPTLYRERINS